MSNITIVHRSIQITLKSLLLLKHTLTNTKPGSLTGIKIIYCKRDFQLIVEGHLCLWLLLSAGKFTVNITENPDGAGKKKNQVEIYINNKIIS